MALQHAKPGDVVNLLTLSEQKSTALVKHERLEVMCISLSAGRSMTEHKVPGPITVQCLKGNCIFSESGTSHELTSGMWLYLEGDTMHAVEAKEDTQLLVTVLFNQNGTA